MQKFLNKVSWGVVAGAAGILAFYLTAGVFGIRFIFAQVNGRRARLPRYSIRGGRRLFLRWILYF